MIEQRGYRYNFWESAVFIVLFLLCIYAYTSKEEKDAGRIARPELTALVHAENSAINECRAVSFHFNKPGLAGGTNLQLLFAGMNTVAQNKILDHQITFLQKDRLSAKPLLLHRLYFRYQYPAEEPPFKA